MIRMKYGIFLALIVVLTGATGCRPRVSKVAQGITPVVANFYVLNIEINELRQVIRDAAPSEADTLQASYQRLLTEAQALSTETLADAELKKRPALKDAMAACLADEQEFLGAESQAVANYAAESRLGDQINEINQHSRGNTIRISEVEGQVSVLFSQQQQYHQQLVKLLPPLVAAAGRCQAELKDYNGVLAAEKIVNYFNDEGIFKLLAWENAGPEHGKPAGRTKRHTASKPRKTKHK